MRGRLGFRRKLDGQTVPTDTGKRECKKPPVVRCVDPGHHLAYHGLDSFPALFTLLLMLHIRLGVPPRENYVSQETNPLLSVIHWMTTTTKSLRRTNITDPILGSSNIIFTTLTFHLTCTAMIGLIATEELDFLWFKDNSLNWSRLETH